jgi:hypothetical protein
MRRCTQLSQIFTPAYRVFDYIRRPAFHRLAEAGGRREGLLDSAPVAVPKARLALLALSLLTTACAGPTLPFGEKPAATFDGGQVSMAAYQVRLKLYQHLYDRNRTTTPGTPAPALDSTAGHAQEVRIEDRAAADLVDEALLSQDASRNHLSITEKDIDGEMSAAKTLAGGDAAFQKFLNDYGYDVNTMRQQLRARLTEVRLENKLAADRIDAAVAMLKTGAAFTDVAKKYSDDPQSAATGGELSLTTDQLKNLDPEVLPALSGLKPGDQTTAPVHATNGWYLFKLLTRDTGGIKVDVVYVFAPDAAHYRVQQRPQWFSTHLSDLEKNAHIKYNVGSHKS